jgi:DNA-directed RNA polymerase specialized sigma24 family protein
MATRGHYFARTARRFAASPEDAEDALGRAVEILLSKGPDSEPGALAAWMQVVTRHEALATGRRAARVPLARGSGGGPLDPDALAAAGPEPAQILERRERVAEAAALLATLKPHERRAIALQAAGCSYAEIQAITGWSYTKVNRCIAEGREALRQRRLEAA